MEIADLDLVSCQVRNWSDPVHDSDFRSGFFNSSLSFQSDLEDAFGPAYKAKFSKRGEAADRLRNILNKYKQGSNCKYDSFLQHHQWLM